MTQDENPGYDLAVELVLAIMRSASTEVIKPIDWWNRAQSAIHSAAAMAESYPHMVSIMCRKLQIDSLCAASSVRLVKLGRRLDGLEFEDFRTLCERDSIYMVADAQVTRALEREDKERVSATLDAELDEVGL